MLLHALGTVLPLAVAMALSSVPVMATIAVLLAPQHARIAPPFLVGSVLGLAFVVTIFTVGALAIPADSPNSRPAGGIAFVVLGIATLVFAVTLWRRSNPDAPPAEPKWMGALDSIGPWTAFGVAFGLGFRPKALILSIAVALAVRTEDLTLSEVAITVGFYLVIAVSTIAAPIIIGLAAPDRAATPLRIAKERIILHGRIITVVILLMIGVVIVGEGLSRMYVGS